MAEDRFEADQAYDSLVESGYDSEVASIVRDQLRVKQLQSYTTEIQELLDAKSELVQAKATELFRVLSESSGLNHTLPTSTTIDHHGIKDSIDLAVSVSHSERGNLVLFVWKTHNIHLTETIPEGFSLGNLNVGKRKETSVESQLPILAMQIRPPAEERRGLFSNDSDSPRRLEVSFRLNRSWIEGKTAASDAQFDSAFTTPRGFLDFLSDHAHNEVYALLSKLIGEVSEVISTYLETKRRFIEGLEV